MESFKKQIGPKLISHTVWAILYAYCIDHLNYIKACYPNTSAGLKYKTYATWAMILLTKIFQETILIIFQSKLRHEGKSMSYLANFMSFLCRLRLFSDSKVCSQWGKFLYYRPKICLANTKNSHSKELNNNFDRYQRIF